MPVFDRRYAGGALAGTIHPGGCGQALPELTIPSRNPTRPSRRCGGVHCPHWPMLTLWEEESRDPPRSMSSRQRKLPPLIGRKRPNRSQQMMGADSHGRRALVNRNVAGRGKHTDPEPAWDHSNPTFSSSEVSGRPETVEREGRVHLHESR